MTMEHFAYPWMNDTFFMGEKADDYRYAHLMRRAGSDSVHGIVDEFQHKVFENIGMTAKERRAIWHQLELTYMPWRNYDGHKFLGEGGFWMQKQHIFVNPFYYIDYALAQICAFQFLSVPKRAGKGVGRLLPSLPGRRKQGIFCTAGAGRTEESVRGWNGWKKSLRDRKPHLKRKVKYTIRPVKEEDLKKVAEVEALCSPAAEAAGS